MIGAGIVLGLSILIPVIHHYQLRFAVEKYISELKAKGEPMELAQVLPPLVPPDQNGAAALLEADALFDRLFSADKSMLETNFVYGMRMVAPGRAMIRWQQPDIRDIDGTNSWENVQAAVAKNAKAFVLLQTIIERPDFDFHIKYERGFADFDYTNLCLVESKRAAQRLESAALCDLHRGDTAFAFGNLRAILALTKSLRDERYEISELVRIAISSFAFSVNWELLQSPNPTDEQLAALQNDWMSLNFVDGCERALEMERVSSHLTAEKWRSSNSGLQRYFGTWFNLHGETPSVWERTKFGARIFRWRNWWSYPDELLAMEGNQISLEAVRFVETNYSFSVASRSLEKKIQQLGINSNSADSMWSSSLDKIDLHSMLSASAMSQNAFFNKVRNAEVIKQMAVSAIALKRYQLKHGSYPLDLNSLVPEFLPSVPLDPVNGQPLRYRLKADGTFLLYSVGDNGVDDGGNPSPPKNIRSSNFYWQNNLVLDWVWPQPATPEEVRNFYEHPPK